MNMFIILAMSPEQFSCTVAVEDAEDSASVDLDSESDEVRGSSRVLSLLETFDLFLVDMAPKF